MFGLDQFISEKVTKRPVSMFLPDIEANKDELEKKIRGKSVLVIGGAGSIGSSFIKAVLPFKPATLVVVDTNENALAELTRDLRSTKGMFVPEDYLPYPMDFASPVFEKMFRSRSGFQIVGNFSAHKHVRSEKDIYSVEALLQNNVLHAKLLLDLLSEYPPEEYFCVSTDKAANPVNIMGASKRIMEDVIFSYSDRFPVKTARFANVAFSNGSLPAGFLARISKLQPLSAPSDVRRFFVSPEESGQICLLACMLGNNREIFFPKLTDAQMMTFDAIATELLKAHGYEILQCSSDREAVEKAEELRNSVVKGEAGIGPGHSQENNNALSGGSAGSASTAGSAGSAGSAESAGSAVRYPVHYSMSDTSGEKPFEEFVTDSETADMNRFKALGVITGKEIPDKTGVGRLFEDLNSAFQKSGVTKEDIVRIIGNYLPNFEHIETGKSLDSKM